MDVGTRCARPRTRAARPYVAWAAIALLLGGCQKKTELTVFYASSLNRTLSDAAQRYQQLHPEVLIHLEPSGSQVAARKVSELGLRPDLVAVADAKLLDRMLVPAHASWSVTFATNELVLAHKDHSPASDEISAENWAAVLLRNAVRLGCVDPDLAPIGYHTRIAWQLAAASGKLPGASPDLAEQLARRCEGQRLAKDEADLYAMLEARAVDYAFLYRSTAEDHRLKITGLPDEYNLSRMDLSGRYASGGLDIRMNQGTGKGRVEGDAITYGLTLPLKAPQPAAAEQFAAFLLGEEGRKITRRAGLRPAEPALASQPQAVPASLRSLVGGAK